MITDNDQQFTDKKLMEFYENLEIKPVTSSVEHSQNNGQAKLTNKIILIQSSKRLGNVKALWAEKLAKVFGLILVHHKHPKEKLYLISHIELTQLILFTKLFSIK